MPVTRYIRQHHIGLIALFIALTGTAYAGTQMANHRAKPQASVAKKKKAKPGPPGPQGPPGTNGAQGPPGTNGASATDIALGGGGTPPSSPLTSVVAATTTVNVSGSGKVLAFGMPTTDYIPTCGSAPGGCVLALGLYVDGTPVPGSLEERTAAMGAALGTYAPVQGLLTGVSPGSHTVTLKLAEEVNGFVAPTTGGATVSAIAPGA